MELHPHVLGKELPGCSLPTHLAGCVEPSSISATSLCCLLPGAAQQGQEKEDLLEAEEADQYPGSCTGSSPAGELCALARGCDGVVWLVWDRCRQEQFSPMWSAAGVAASWILSMGGHLSAGWIQSVCRPDLACRPYIAHPCCKTGAAAYGVQTLIQTSLVRPGIMYPQPELIPLTRSVPCAAPDTGSCPDTILLQPVPTTP